jgi:uncharacterized protein (DUF58 family)
VLTRWAGVWLVAGAAAVAGTRQPWVALVFIAAMLAVIGVDVLLAAAPGDLRLSRDGDRQVRLGDTATVALVVTNRGRRTLTADVRDAWVPSAGAEPGTFRIRLAPGERISLDTSLTPTRRGDRPAAMVTIRSFGPLRHAYRQSRRRTAQAATPPWTLRVLPRFDSKQFLAEKLTKLRIFDGSVVTRGRGQGTEFDALREYVIGDDVRSIDWRATARRADVVVRTWRPERDRHIFCVIDTGRTSAVRVGTTSTDPGDVHLDEPRLDAAIDAALLLAEVANRAGDKVSMIAVDSALRTAVSGGSNRALLPKMVAALAPLQPQLRETDFGLVVSEILRRERKRALVVLFSALEPGALGEGLMPVLSQLTARHRVLVAAVHDQSISDLIGVHGTPDDIYLSVSAQKTLTERRRVAAALGRHNVDVIDAPVKIFASKVTDAYLELKAAGKL